MTGQSYEYFVQKLYSTQWDFYISIELQPELKNVTVRYV